MKTIRILATIVCGAVLVPCIAAFIGMLLLGLRHGQGFLLLTASVQAAALVPLAVLAAPAHAIGTGLVAGFSLGMESLLRRSSIWIWLAHAAAIGGLCLLAFLPVYKDPEDAICLVGSWMAIGALMWKLLSDRTIQPNAWRARHPGYEI